MTTDLDTVDRAEAPVDGVGDGAVRVRVVEVRDVSDCVRLFRLVSADDAPLSGWAPGAHLEIVLPSGLVRQYSLCGSPAERGAYEIAVLREPTSRGGSVEMHERIGVGDVIEVRSVRNHFKLVPAPAYLFVAGGVGITPILPMIAAAQEQGASWRLVYGGRSRDSMAFLDRLGAVEGVEVVPQDTDGLPDLAAEIGGADVDALIYACGPEGLLAALEAECAAQGRGSALHLERFGAGGDLAAEVEGDVAFEVELQRTGAVLTVPPGTSILAAVRELMDAPSSCEEGFCGSCETRIVSGVADHRDVVLSEDEQRENATMMICVSRAACPRLVLDL
ncbi:MAG: PDR/VanB family oxidoreductase [Nocardioides sp.]|uniref:PDR/VanB family oxidoreductase n=1 Tax=Nocardioides sp. TaxID=35761 RepID=UPI0039E2FB07